MSKYDRLDYLTRSEKEKKGYPECIKRVNKDYAKIPEDLIGITIQEFKKYLNIENSEEENKFQYANNGQTILNEDYFKNGKFLSDKMDKDEKREFLLDYMSYFFGSEIDGKYFEDNLQDMFKLRKYELIDEDFDIMIKDYFKKDVINLNDPDDRAKFKNIIFYRYIKCLTDEEIQKQSRIEEESSKNSKNSSIYDN